MANKKSREHQQSITNPEPTDAMPVIIHPDGTIEPVEIFFSRLTPEVARLKDQAIASYQKELAELKDDNEKKSRNLPDSYREPYLHAAQAFREIALTMRYGSEQGIKPDNELMVALTLEGQAKIEEITEILGQFVATTDSKYSTESFKEIFFHCLHAAALSPKKLRRERVENFANEGRKTKSLIFAEELLAEKQFLKMSGRVLQAIGITRKRKASRKISNRDLMYEEAAAHFDKLQRTGKYRSKEQIYDAICKKFPNLAPGYALLDYHSKAARKIRKQIGSGIQYQSSKIKK